jgi:hypothetical protein
MTAYQEQVLRAVERCPGAGACNVCDYVGGMEVLDIYNAGRALDKLQKRGWLDENCCLTEKAEQYLKGRAA